jgi:predicted transposase/invertase (TIGR01784 family)
MQDAIEAYKTVSNSAEFRELDRMLAKARHDEAQALSHAKEEGIVEGEKIGLAKGKREGTLTVAKNLLLINLPLDQIVKATGLTYKEVEALQNGNAD